MQDSMCESNFVWYKTLQRTLSREEEGGLWDRIGKRFFSFSLYARTVSGILENGEGEKKGEEEGERTPSGKSKPRRPRPTGN